MNVENPSCIILFNIVEGVHTSGIFKCINLLTTKERETSYKAHK